jgi:hypothetical protein
LALVLRQKQAEMKKKKKNKKKAVVEGMVHIADASYGHRTLQITSIDPA